MDDNVKGVLGLGGGTGGCVVLTLTSAGAGHNKAVMWPRGPAAGSGLTPGRR